DSLPQIFPIYYPVLFRREPTNPQKKCNKKRQTDEPHHSHWFIGGTRSFNNSSLNPLLFALEMVFGIKLPTWALQSNDSKQDVGVTKAVFKTFMNMGSLMENDGIPQYWDSGKLENFENIVYRQISENICNLGVSAQEDEDGFAQRDAALTHYFQKLAALLKEKEFSVCAWERVRHELLRVLQVILLENNV
uniref:Uncharacterized protein n=1 Tax=Astyanax mexicanus TaxID=7994 RepID=A0A8B9GPM3_ASTMX